MYIDMYGPLIFPAPENLSYPAEQLRNHPATQTRTRTRTTDLEFALLQKEMDDDIRGLCIIKSGHLCTNRLSLEMPIKVLLLPSAPGELWCQ